MFLDLFRNDLAVLHHIALDEEKKYSQELIGQSKKNIQMIVENCGSLTALRSEAMALIIKDVESPSGLALENIETVRAQEVAPHILQLLTFYEEEEDLNNSTASMMV